MDFVFKMMDCVLRMMISAAIPQECVAEISQEDLSCEAGAGARAGAGVCGFRSAVRACDQPPRRCCYCARRVYPQGGGRARKSSCGGVAARRRGVYGGQVPDGRRADRQRTS